MSTGERRWLQGVLLGGALLFLASGGCYAEKSVRWDDVLKGRPGTDADIRKPFEAMSTAELVSILNQNVHEEKLSISDCNIEWQWTLSPQPGLPYKSLKVRIDSRELEGGGGEINNGKLLYHPQSQGDKFWVIAPDGKVLLRQAWHSLRAKDDNPQAYWHVVGAFQVLTEQVARTCAERTPSTRNK